MEGELLQPYTRSRWEDGENRAAGKKMWVRNIRSDPGVEKILSKFVHRITDPAVAAVPAFQGLADFLSVRTGQEENPWKRVAILPRIEGQKYTLGQTFASREVDGEFILVPLTPASNEKSGCQITVEQGKYWVSHTAGLSARSTVLINDVKVGEKTELKFGDHLCLGGKNSLFFKERELDPGAFIYSATANQKMSKEQAAERLAKIKESSVEFTPGKNELTLSHILSYLPVGDVKSCRFVSKLWNVEGFKILKKRSTLDLDFSVCQQFCPEPVKLLRYLVEMKDNPLPNWRITIPNDEEEYGRKLLADLEWFLSGENATIHHVKRLELGSFFTKPESEYEFCYNILQTLGQHLEELTLSGNWYLTEWVKNRGWPETIQLPNLKVFTLFLANEGK